MGQSITTPLTLTLQNWRDVQNTANNLSVDIRRKRWATLCSSEWPTFSVGWPRDGTFDQKIILQVKAKVMNPGPSGHPDQVAYVITWEALVSDPLPWVRPFILPKPPLLPSAPPLSPPLLPTPARPPSRSSLFPAQTDPRKPKLSSQVLPPEENLLVDLLSEEPPPYPEPNPPPPVADSTDERPAEAAPAAPSPMAGRLRGRRSPMAARLGGRGDQPLTADSTVSQTLPLRVGGTGQLQYWPFSSSDLYNWKNNNPSFSDDPIRLTALIESVLVTHQPTWDDCQQLLQALLTSDERQRVLLEARKAVRGPDGRLTQLPNEVDSAFPLDRPTWDYTTQEGRNHLTLYRQLLIAGLQGAGRRPTNLAKVKQVLQESGEAPSAFLERLKEAYRRYTPYDPEDPGQETSVSMSFIWQSAPDIRRKLERLEDLRESKLADLLKEAEKIFNKRETPEEREDRFRREAEERDNRLRKEAEERERERDKRRHREMSKLLTTVVSGQAQDRQGGDPRRPGPRVEKDQCAYCKEKGHWVKDCPKRPKGPRKPKPQTPLLTLDD